jgi:hypothetical protein
VLLVLPVSMAKALKEMRALKALLAPLAMLVPEGLMAVREPLDS